MCFAAIVNASMAMMSQPLEDHVLFLMNIHMLLKTFSHCGQIIYIVGPKVRIMQVEEGPTAILGTEQGIQVIPTSVVMENLCKLVTESLVVH